jgi:D-amino-acid dehydrogenase
MSSSSRHAVIIGGGVIGTACAYFLMRSGWKVTIVEKGAHGSGSSSGNCGLVCPSHVLPMAEPGMVAKGLAALLQKNSPLAIKFRMDPALWSWLVHFALRCNHRDIGATTATSWTQAGASSRCSNRRWTCIAS